MGDNTAGQDMAFGRLQPIKTVQAGVLEIGYFEAGPSDGTPVLLLHGFPFDIHSYVEVAPQLSSANLRVIVPYLRGYGPTRFIDPDTPRSGQQGALGADVIALMDALDIPRAILAGYDWGGRAASVAAALWPERCAGLVSNGYLIQDVAAAFEPKDPELEAKLWFFFYFATERGRRGLSVNRRALTRLIWHQLSPGWDFDDATFDRTAGAFDNQDYVAVVIHNYRHRLGLVPGDPEYEDLEKQLATLPPITVPTVTLHGETDQNPGSDFQADHFTGPYTHHEVPKAGHNLPGEAPQAFTQAVLDLARSVT
jgi:pimeloyl-ACP methyl ester carboxylesterase